METLADRIKYLRLAHRMNQSTFAKEILISQASLSDIEKGKSKPSLDTLNNISEQFGVSTDWLIKGDTGLAAQYADSQILQNIFNAIPQQLSKNKSELMQQFNVDKKFINTAYNIYFLKFILSSLTSDEKRFFQIFRSLDSASRKESITILEAIYLNKDIETAKNIADEA